MKRLVKIFWRRLSRPSKAAAGVLLGFGFVGGILFWGAFNTGMEATNTEAFCSGCHAPIVAEIRETIYYSNRSGGAGDLFGLPRTAPLDR